MKKWCRSPFTLPSHPRLHHPRARPCGTALASRSERPPRPREKWVLEKWVLEKWVLEKWVLEKWLPYSAGDTGGRLNPTWNGECEPIERFSVVLGNQQCDTIRCLIFFIPPIKRMSSHSIYCPNTGAFEAVKSRCEKHGFGMKCLFYSPIPTPDHHVIFQEWSEESSTSLNTFYVHTDCGSLMDTYSLDDLPSTKVITHAVQRKGTFDGDRRDTTPVESCNYEIIRPNFVTDQAHTQDNMSVCCSFLNKASYEDRRMCINRATISSHAKGWRWSIAKTNHNQIRKCTRSGECDTVTQHKDHTDFVHLMDVENLLKWVQCSHEGHVLSTLKCEDDLQLAISRCSKIYPVVVLFFADWCGHCTTFKHIWNEAVTSCFDTDLTCWVACNEKDDAVKPCLVGIEGFPTVQLHYNGRVTTMSSRKTVENLISFSKSMGK